MPQFLSILESERPGLSPYCPFPLFSSPLLSPSLLLFSFFHLLSKLSEFRYDGKLQEYKVLQNRSRTFKEGRRVGAGGGDSHLNRQLDKGVLSVWV